jgi:hypothetical protein
LLLIALFAKQHWNMQSLRRALKRAVNSSDNIVADLTQEEQNEHSTKRMKVNSAVSASLPVGHTDKYSAVFDAVLAQVRGGPTTSETCSDTQQEDAVEYSRHDELFVKMLDCQRQLMDAMNAKLDEVLSFLNTNCNFRPAHSADHLSSAPTRVAEVTEKSDSSQPSVHPVRSSYRTADQPATQGRLIANNHISKRPSNSNSRHFVHSAVRTDVDVDPLEDSGEDPDAHTTMIIHRTLRDTARRRCNVIVSGLPEERDNEGDRQSFLRICEEWLPMKPALSEGSCVRIGHQQPGLPRRLLVRTGSEEMATTLLKVAHLLRQADDVDVSERVYINPDLAPEAARLAYEQRQNRRAARQRRDAPPIRTDTSRPKQADHPRPRTTASSSSIHHTHVPINTLHVVNSNHPTDCQKVNNITNENQSAVDIVSGLLCDTDNSMDDSLSMNANMSENIHLRYTAPASSNPVVPAPATKSAAEDSQTTTITITADVHQPQDSEVQSLPSSPTQDHATTGTGIAAESQ